MKLLFRKSYGRSVFAALPALLTMLFAVACQDDESQKWVDLRYKAEDAYILEATAPSPIRLQVKSTDPWRVYGLHDDWCTITPAEGTSGEIFDVEVRYSDNSALDDRIDTLIIRSDYWIGKWIQVRQKGIAYLDLEDADNVELLQTGSSGSFKIRSNQDWSVRLGENASWLNVSSDLAGSGDGEIAFSAGENKGERRYADLVICDRHGETVHVVTVAQVGVQLDPAETLIKTDYTAKTYSLDVVSNASWTVSREDEQQEWFSFEKTSFEGSDKLVITIGENPNTSIRNATIILRTIKAEGVTQVEKRIVLRQANDPVPEHYEFNSGEQTKWSVNQGTASFADGDVTFSPGRLLRYEFRTGNYKIRIKKWDATAVSTLYFCNGDFEIRWHLNAGKKTTDISVRNANSTAVHKNIAFDPSTPHEIGLRMSETVDGYTRYEWLLDGVAFNSYAADGSDGGSRKIKFGSKYSVFLGCSSGTVTYDWWEYAIPYEYFDWDD